MIYSQWFFTYFTLQKLEPQPIPDSWMLPLWKKNKNVLFAEKYDLTSLEAMELGSAPPLLQDFPGKTLIQGAFWTLILISL